MNSYELDKNKIDLMYLEITKLVKEAESNNYSKTKMKKSEIISKVGKIIEREVGKCY